MSPVLVYAYAYARLSVSARMSIYFIMYIFVFMYACAPMVALIWLDTLARVCVRLWVCACMRVSITIVVSDTLWQLNTKKNTTLHFIIPPSEDLYHFYTPLTLACDKLYLKQSKLFINKRYINIIKSQYVLYHNNICLYKSH